MDSRILLVWMYVLGSVGGLLMVVTAEPAVNAWIVTPETDRKEGGQVVMRCVATNLQSNHIVEWATEDPNMTLRWGESPVTTNRRFEFETTHPGTGQTTQVFTITDLQRNDTDEYICNVKYPIPSGGSNILATSSVKLSVLYFPSESFPICSPDGPITVHIGTELNMQCSSESGNWAVTMAIYQIPITSDTYTWTTSTNADTVWRSLTLTVDSTDEDVKFLCTIASASFPGMSPSCSIGPISVQYGTEPMAEYVNTIQPTTVTSELTDTSSLQTSLPKTTQQGTDAKTDQSPTIPVAAFVVSVILLAVSVIIIIFFIYYVIKLRRLIESLRSKSTNLPTADPYMELQPTDDKNIQYMDPATTGTTSAHHTYCQALEAEDESPEYDYAKPEDKNLKCEVTSVPQNKDTKYENIMS